jgi:hypothetical protein
MSYPYTGSSFIWTGSSINSSIVFPYYGFMSGPMVSAIGVFTGTMISTNVSGIPFSSLPRQPEPKITCVRRKQCKNDHCGGCAGYEPEPEPVSEKINKRIKGMVEKL